MTVEFEDAQCARCGSSIGWDDCQTCPAGGHVDAPDPSCPVCKGSGTVAFCLSTFDWCAEHPRPGREQVMSGTPEWYVVLTDGTVRVKDHE